jgi:hypothetical protein
MPVADELRVSIPATARLVSLRRGFDKPAAGMRLALKAFCFAGNLPHTKKATSPAKGEVAFVDLAIA